MVVICSTKPLRRISDVVGLAVIGLMLLIQLVYLGLGFIARDFSVAVGTYQISEPVAEHEISAGLEAWLSENAKRQAGAAFEDLVPAFRAHEPLVKVERSHFQIIVLVGKNEGLQSRFESIGRALGGLLVEQRQIAAGAPTFRLTKIQVTPYPWFKSLDFVSLFVLIGAIAAWLALPNKADANSNA